MGSFSGYSSPKTSYEPSYSVPSTPKSSSYESSKVSSAPMSKSIPSTPSRVSDEILDDTLSSKSDLNSFRNLITSYLEVMEKIEKATATLSTLQQQKAALEEKLSSNPKFEKFSTMFTSINDSKTDSKGPKR